MVLPSFRVKNEGGDYSYESSTRTPQYTSESIFHGDRMVVDGNTIGIGALKTRPKGQDKPDGSTQPGQQPEPNGSTTPGVIRDGSTGTT